jgi:hypothetical protein
MVQKVDEVSNFAFVKLIEQEPGLYDKAIQITAGGTKWTWFGMELHVR